MSLGGTAWAAQVVQVGWLLGENEWLEWLERDSDQQEWLPW